jgi:putative transposase
LLQENKYEEANGFYSRSLRLAIGKLDLKIPRIRIGNNFRPALLPSKWKRVNKDYENLLLALLTNGYSQTQIERALHALDLPYSQERIEELTSLIHERFEVFRTSPFFTSYTVCSIHRCLACEDDNDDAAAGVGRIKDVTIFTALGIDTEGHKSILGFWVNEGDENKALWADVFQDMVTRGF